MTIIVESAPHHPRNEGSMAAVNVERFRVFPNNRFHLTDIDSNDSGLESDGERSEIEDRLKHNLHSLRDLQARLYAERERALLIILLATDTGGKDSTIRRIFSGVNPQGCRVVSFGRPTEEELSHDFLWRVHRHTPSRGLIGIFNRSHYEDVTVPRVKGDIDHDELLRRYEHIRNFESLLHDSGVTILKFHLSISKDEQAERLQDRLEDPGKHWKFDPSDIEDREHWAEYQTAFEDAVNATSTDHAPWFVVPANRKWFRDAVISRIIVQTLKRMDPQYPPPVENLDTYEVR